MDLYLATINTPGYLPMSDERNVFASVADAWRYLADERYRAEEYAADAEGNLSETWGELDTRADQPAPEPGTVYGPTPGYDGDHDLGVAYTVSLWAHVDYPHEHGHLYDCEPCEYTCHGHDGTACAPGADCVHCALVAAEESVCESAACEAPGHE